MLKKIDVFLPTFILLMILIDVILQILSRVLPGNSISWTVELGQMLLGGLIWLGISSGIKEGAHVNFDLIINKFTPKRKKIVEFINNSFFIIYFILLGIFTVQLLYYYTAYDSRSTILRVSMFWVRLPILVGCVFGVIRMVIKQIELVKGKGEYQINEEGGSK